MDEQIRRRAPSLVASSLVALAQPARQTITLPGSGTKVNAFALRRAILDCVATATAAEPADTDARVQSFVARLSATMEGLGERELDAALWGLMETKSSHAKVG